MRHESYERMVEGSDTAVLFLHGILGTPAHFQELIALVPQNWSVCAPLLPGHGGSVRDFSRSSMAQWKEAVSECVLRLGKTHKRMIIAAHSMGTLFAIREALDRPQLIRGLFLLAAPLKLSPKPAVLGNMLKLCFGRVRENDLPAVAARDACSIRLTKNILAYLGWIPRYLELFSEIRAVRLRAGELRLPVEVYQSAGDELVSAKAADYFDPEGSRCFVLAHSRHYYYGGEDGALLKSTFGDFLANCL